MKVDGEKCLTECDCFVLLPHQWVESLQQGELLVNLTCTENDLILFWESQKKSLGQIPQSFYFFLLAALMLSWLHSPLTKEPSDDTTALEIIGL